MLPQSNEKKNAAANILYMSGSKHFKRFTDTNCKEASVSKVTNSEVVQFEVVADSSSKFESARQLYENKQLGERVKYSPLFA